jgi:3-oxoacyl-[acyl-carrier protein] reductase
LSDRLRNVLVTGASRGLGLAIAERLAAAGFRVLAVARTQSEPLARLRQAAASGPGAVVFMPFDLSDTDGLGGLAREARSRFGPVYGLVNNAGASLEGALANLRPSDIERLVRLNTLSPILLTKHLVRAMMADGEGRVINMASIMASTGFSGLSVYGATKASLVGFTKSLAREVGRFGVTVNAVAPGFIATDLTAGMTDEETRKIARRSALGRLAEARDVAGAVAFLLGEEARNVTGTVITVDAGATS